MLLLAVFCQLFFPSSFLLSKKSSIEKTIDFFTTTIFSFLLYPKFHLVKIVVVVKHSGLILEIGPFIQLLFVIDLICSMQSKTCKGTKNQTKCGTFFMKFKTLCQILLLQISSEQWWIVSSSVVADFLWKSGRTKSEDFSVGLYYILISLTAAARSQWF